MQFQILAAFGLWPLATLWLVHALGPMRGLVASFIGGFLLLPFVSIPVADGLPPITRDGVIATSAATALLVLAPRTLTRYQFHWMDLFVLGALVVWGVTNLANGLGIQQALLDWWWFTMFAAVPYFLGRCVLDRPHGLVVLAVGIAAGTLLMIPFVLFELRMSPRLHATIYGVWGNTVDMYRLGGWRPKVFQPVGLGLAIWLSTSAVVAYGVWYSKAVTNVWRIPTTVVMASCVVMGVLGRGGGAISLMALGLCSLGLALLWRRPRLVLLVPAAVAIYIVTGFVDAAVPIRPLMLSAGELVWGSARSDSLLTRLENEQFLIAAAMQNPLLGFGGWGDFRQDVELARQLGVRKVLTDGFWTIALGQRGLLGLLCVYGMYLLPGAIAVISATRARVSQRSTALVAAVALFCWLYAADLLFNAFPTPVIGLAAGALISFALRLPTVRMPRTSLEIAVDSNSPRCNLPHQLNSRVANTRPQQLIKTTDDGYHSVENAVESTSYRGIGRSDES